MKTLVTGAAGFIGHWLVRYLKGQGHWVRGVDINQSPYPGPRADDHIMQNLRSMDTAIRAVNFAGQIYALAANMGGIGFITRPQEQYRILTGNLDVNVNTARAAQICGVSRLLFTSSVCVYPMQLLSSLCPNLLTEDQAIPANPQDSYGWEKLTAEAIYHHAPEINARIVRLENTYGPECQWRGGREKAPAALCRKVAHAKLTGQDSIEIWGDGEQTRTFMFIDDCVRGLVTIMESDEERPINLGPDESVSIDYLAGLIMEVAGIDLRKVYIEGPEGVRGRNFSHERVKALGWQAEVSLRDGIAKTYEWVEGEVMRFLAEDPSRYE